LLEALGVADLASGIYIGAVVFAAYLVRGIAGFGSGLIAVPLLSLVAPVPAVVPLVVSLDYVGSASQGVHNVERVAWRDQLALVPFMIGGVAAGLLLLTALSSAALGRALGAFILLYAIYQWLPLPELRGSRLFAAPCGLLGGLVGTVFGTGGPFYVIYLNLRALERSAFRATFAANYLIDGGVRLAAYVVMGLLGGRTLVAIAVTLPVAAAGLYLGGRIQTGLSQTAFVRFISVLLLASGIALLVK
jgi:uncharacterized membrane protein YfcA